MRAQAISLLVISALICSASARFSIYPVATFLESFAASLNYDDTNPTFANCSAYINATKEAALAIIHRNFMDYPVELIYAFGDNFAEATHYCSKAAMKVPKTLQYFRDGLRNLTLKGFSMNILSNSYSINKNTFYLRYALYKGIYDDSGEIFADLLKIFIFGDVKIPVKRQLFELDQFADMVGASSTLESNIYSLLQGSQGFMDKAMIPDFTKMLQDFSGLLSKIPALEKAIEAQDFPVIMDIAKDLYYKVMNTTQDSAAFNQQLVAFLQRELPTFQDKAKVAKGIESLVANLPVTLVNIQKIAVAYQNKDFKEVGQQIRVIFNQIRDGANSN